MNFSIFQSPDPAQNITYADVESYYQPRINKLGRIVTPAAEPINEGPINAGSGPQGMYLAADFEKADPSGEWRTTPMRWTDSGANVAETVTLMRDTTKEGVTRLVDAWTAAGFGNMDSAYAALSRLPSVQAAVAAFLS